VSLGTGRYVIYLFGGWVSGSWEKVFSGDCGQEGSNGSKIARMLRGRLNVQVQDCRLRGNG
jgi:hypothetical protein